MAKVRATRLGRLLLAALIISLGMAGTALAAPAACDLITQAEAAQVLGMEVKPPRAKDVVGMAAGTACAYFTAAPIAKVGGTGSLKVTLHDPASFAKADGPFKSPADYFKRRQKTLGAKAVPVAGLGQAAFWLDSGYGLHILQGDYYVVVSVVDLAKISGSSMADMQKKLSAHRLELAKKVAQEMVLPRLK